PRPQKAERRPAVDRLTTKLRDGPFHQRKSLAEPSSEGVGAAENGRDIREHDDELPGSAELVAPLESPDRQRNVAATEMGETEVDQSQRQGVGMISRFRGPHGSTGVLDGLIEPATLGEHVGQPPGGQSRLDDGSPEALIAQVSLERDVPF